MKKSIKEIKDELVSRRNRADQARERISDIKDGNLEMMLKRQERLEHTKYKNSLSERSHYIRKSTIRTAGLPEEEEGSKATERLFKQRVDRNLPKLWKELDPQIQEANRTPFLGTISRFHRECRISLLVHSNDNFNGK